MMEKDLYTLLVKSFDTELGTKDRQRLEQGLLEDPLLRSEKEKMEKIRALLSEKEDDFAPFFETRVMGRIESQESFGGLFTEKLAFVFRRVAILSMGIVIALIITTWAREGSINIETITGISELRGQDASTFLLY